MYTYILIFKRAKTVKIALYSILHIYSYSTLMINAYIMTGILYNCIRCRFDMSTTYIFIKSTLKREHESS